MYKRNELYRQIADGTTTPEQLVDIILNQQANINELQRGIKVINNYEKDKNDCRIAVIDKGKMVKAFKLTLNSVPIEGEVLTITTKSGSVMFKVINVVRDIMVSKGESVEVNNIFVERMGKD